MFSEFLPFTVMYLGVGLFLLGWDFLGLFQSENSGLSLVEHLINCIFDYVLSFIFSVLSFWNIYFSGFERLRMVLQFFSICLHYFPFLSYILFSWGTVPQFYQFQLFF